MDAQPKPTTRMCWILKTMREQDARIEEERADEVSHFWLVSKTPGSLTSLWAEVTEAVLDKLCNAGLVVDMKVGWYKPDTQRWTRPAEVYDLPERGQRCAGERLAAAYYRSGQDEVDRRAEAWEVRQSGGE